RRVPSYTKSASPHRKTRPRRPCPAGPERTAPAPPAPVVHRSGHQSSPLNTPAIWWPSHTTVSSSPSGATFSLIKFSSPGKWSAQARGLPSWPPARKRHSVRPSEVISLYMVRGSKTGARAATRPGRAASSSADGPWGGGGASSAGRAFCGSGGAGGGVGPAPAQNSAPPGGGGGGGGRGFLPWGGAAA